MVCAMSVCETMKEQSLTIFFVFVCVLLFTLLFSVSGVMVGLNRILMVPEMKV